MTRPVVFLSQPMHPAGIERLRARCELIEGIHHPVADDAAIAQALRHADAVMIRSMPLGADRIALAPRLRVIAKHGAGLDSIDIPAATARGIVVANSGDANAFAVAQHAVALMLAVRRDIRNVDRLVRAGGYQRRETMTDAVGDLWQATVGIVGLGHIGRHVAQMVGRGFDARLLGFDPMVSAEQAAQFGVEKVDALPDLLARADIVSLHLPLNAHTRDLIGEAELRMMKRSACLVNTARGGVIDEAALVRALEQGLIHGAGLDVFEEEPPAADHPLFASDRVILSPHIGGRSEASRVATSNATADAILAVLGGGEPAHFVNRAALAQAGASGRNEQPA
jgi:D-3-phosphoglycerate dehydrogenase / 2-oxoglutarate reductase